MTLTQDVQLHLTELLNYILDYCEMLIVLNQIYQKKVKFQKKQSSVGVLQNRCFKKVVKFTGKHVLESLFNKAVIFKNIFFTESGFNLKLKFFDGYSRILTTTFGTTLLFLNIDFYCYWKFCLKLAIYKKGSSGHIMVKIHSPWHLAPKGNSKIEILFVKIYLVEN